MSSNNYYNTRQARLRRVIIPEETSTTREPLSRQQHRSRRPPRVVSVAQPLPRLRPRLNQSPYSRGSSEGAFERPSSPLSTLLPCPICCEDMHPSVQESVSCLECGHVYCTSCITRWVAIKPICPKCNRSIPAGKDSVKRLYLE